MGGKKAIILGFTLLFSPHPASLFAQLLSPPVSSDAGSESFPGVSPRGFLCRSSTGRTLRGAGRDLSVVI